MWEESGTGTVVIILCALYYVIKYAVKNGVMEAHEEISGKKVKDDLDEILEREEKDKEKNR